MVHLANGFQCIFHGDGRYHKFQFNPPLCHIQCNARPKSRKYTLFTIILCFPLCLSFLVTDFQFMIMKIEFCLDCYGFKVFVLHQKKNCYSQFCHLQNIFFWAHVWLMMTCILLFGTRIWIMLLICCSEHWLELVSYGYMYKWYHKNLAATYL